jgi:tRNA(Ile)-lysidine synthase
VVAVSGGPDSVALAWLLSDLQAHCGFTLAAFAHVNHGLRGAAADADEAFCRELAERLGVASSSETVDVKRAAVQWKTSIENAARRLRYAALERARLTHRANFVAVAHTRDDQAETFVLRLLRGAGARGLGGMRPLRGTIVRPLLEIGRAELHEWLADCRGDVRIGPERLAYRLDATNADVSIPRNRVRHELMPLLGRIAPRAAETIARAARLAADDDDFLEGRVTEVVPTIVLSSEGADGQSSVGRRLRVDLQPLKSLHPALGRRVVRRLLAEVAPRRFFALRHVDALIGLVVGGLDLPGVAAQIEGNGRVLTLSAAPKGGSRRVARIPASNVFRYSLSIPGEVEVPESGVVISAEVLDAGVSDVEAGGGAVRIDAEAIRAGLAVRNRKPGDRFRPVGLGGSKKLQDYFVDRKVPRSERDRVPLVVDAHDRIVWVVGHTIAEDFRARSGDAGGKGTVLLLKVRHLGDSV